MSSFPPEIITSILIRLPVKSLLRFRCVSKPWCAEIDSSYFIKLHLTHSIATSSNHSPIAQYEGALYFIDSVSFENIVKIETPLTYPRIISTCNGLLLLQWVSQSLILFNPFTRKHLLLPAPPYASKYADVASGLNCLGYDVVNDDYKVFNILVYLNFSIGCNVYSLKSTKWHIVKDFAKGFMFMGPFEAYVHGALHTINGIDHKSIVALDVGQEACNFISMPDVKDKNVLLFTAQVFDGCLAGLCRYPDDRTDIWVMKEYGVKESWSMLLSVKPDNRCKVIPMVYSKSRTEVLLSYNGDKLVWYDLRKKTVRAFQVSGLPNGFGPMVCVESLVSIGERKKHPWIEEIDSRDSQENR